MSTFCKNCGLPESLMPGLSGCTQDTVMEHEFVDVKSRPYEDWSVDAILAREARATRKADSAWATAEHFAICPVSGGDALGRGRESYVFKLYDEKALKRRNIANQLIRELAIRSEETQQLRDELQATERPFRLR